VCVMECAPSSLDMCVLFTWGRRREPAMYNYSQKTTPARNAAMQFVTCASHTSYAHLRNRT